MSTLTTECDLLSSFALCMDLPYALVERDFHDYFHDSVTLPLSRFRSILSSIKCLSLYVGAHARHFPLREGWLQRERAEKIVPFPCTLDTGDSPFSCGLSPFRHDLDLINQDFTLYSFTDEPLAAFDWSFTHL